MGLYEDILRQPVRILNIRQLVAVTPDTPVRTVVERLRKVRLGCAIVVDPDGRPTGMFTECVLARAMVSKLEILDEPVGENMADEWAKVSVTDPITHVLTSMEEHRMRFVCVTDEDGRAVGLTGQKGLMEYFADHFPKHVQTMARRVGTETTAQQREGG